MKKTGLIFLAVIFVALLAFMTGARETGAQSSYYSGKGCSSCHGTTSTCNGCHAHGVHSSTGGSTVNLSATPDKSSYQPGEAMQVTLTGGNKSGWLRATLFDSAGNEVAQASTSYPAILTATAPTTPGSYTWKAGWYGNAYDKSGAAFVDWTPDPNNTDAPHGWEKVAFSFQVSAPATADITVTDSVLPAGDLSVPFGSVTQGSFAEQTVTVKNDGNANLTVGTIGTPNALAAPFSIQLDNCSGKTIAPLASCTFKVRFAPTTAGAFSDSFTVPSNDPDENPVTINVTGSGTAVLIPDVTVTDSVLPAGDLSVPFGSVTQGSFAEQTVTVKNDGNGNLTMGSLGTANPLAAPFSIVTNGCSGITLIPGASCAVKIKFAPVTVGNFSDSFDIPSNDPDENPVTVNVSGSGTALPVAEITVTDSVAPVGDLQVPFGGVTAGSTAEQTVTVKNDGNADLTVGTIGTPNALAAPFSIQFDNCSGKTIAPLASCTFKVRFAPVAAGTFSDTFTVPSNDSDENPVTLSVSGTGTALPVADITVTDSAAPAGDLAVPFGDVTQGSWAEQTVTVKNDGNASLVIGSVGQANPLAAPFSIQLDNCSGKTLASLASCTLTVRFSPTVVGGLNDSFDIPSNDPDENPVTVSVNGTGTGVPVADITVTDSVAPSGDLSVPFGIVTEGGSAEQTVTVKNDGNANLVIGSAGTTNPLAAPFSIIADNCSGKTLIPTGTCAVTVGFAPTAGGAFNDSFDISSSDPDENPVTVSVSGTGSSSSSVPDISVKDPVPPEDDLSVSFGDVTSGNTVMKKIAVSNVGSGVLSIGIVTPPSSPFSIKKEDCSGRSLGTGQSCHIEVNFAPTGEGSFSSSLVIPSNDPDENPVTISLNGNGLSSGANNPPCKPKPHYPAHGQAGLGNKIDFKWEVCEDPDGDSVQYSLEIDNDSEFGGDGEVPEVSGNVRLYAGLGSSLGLLLVGLALIGGMKRRRKIALLVLALAIAGILLVSCGGGGGEGTTSPTSEITQTVDGLDSGTTYYWKVVGDDGHGNIVESETVSFSTE